MISILPDESYYQVPWVRKRMATRALPGATENLDTFDLWEADPHRAHQQYMQDQRSAEMDLYDWNMRTNYGGRP